MTQRKRILKTLKVKNKGYGDLDGSEFLITEALYDQLNQGKAPFSFLLGIFIVFAS
ncbi:MAG: hypothetical protein V1850_01485 [Candidatus Bathyarchaeota archaeon]